jgi:hypothetical protein
MLDRSRALALTATMKQTVLTLSSAAANSKASQPSTCLHKSTCVGFYIIHHYIFARVSLKIRSYKNSLEARHFMGFEAVWQQVRN